MDYRLEVYSYLGNSSSRRGIGSYLYSGEVLKEERLDVLGLFPWVYKGARNILGEGLGLNKPRVLLCTYCTSNS